MFGRSLRGVWRPGWARVWGWLRGRWGRVCLWGSMRWGWSIAWGFGCGVCVPCSAWAEGVCPLNRPAGEEGQGFKGRSVRLPAVQNTGRDQWPVWVFWLLWDRSVHPRCVSALGVTTTRLHGGIASVRGRRFEASRTSSPTATVHTVARCRCSLPERRPRKDFGYAALRGSHGCRTFWRTWEARAFTQSVQVPVMP